MTVRKKQSSAYSGDSKSGSFSLMPELRNSAKLDRRRTGKRKRCPRHRLHVEKPVHKLRCGPVIQKGNEPGRTVTRRPSNSAHDPRVASSLLVVLAGQLLKVDAIVRNDHEATTRRNRQLLFIGGTEHVFTARGVNRKAVTAHDSGDSDVNVLVKVQLSEKPIRFHCCHSS